MSFRQKLQFQLVKKLCISNNDALDLIRSGRILVNHQICVENKLVHFTDTIEIEGKILSDFHLSKFYILNKPKGIECTLNPNIPNNICTYLPNNEQLFHIGRLDKDSQGLLLFSNDGRIHDKILRNHKNPVYKKYHVIVNDKIDSDFISKMESGIEIMGRITEPCRLEKIDDFSFFIYLNQGLNRQIRRMCFKLNRQVIFLERTEIGELKLGQLAPGNCRKLQEIEMSYIVNLLKS